VTNYNSVNAVNTHMILVLHATWLVHYVFMCSYGGELKRSYSSTPPIRLHGVVLG